MDSPFKCELCGSCFSMKQVLGRHYRETHELKDYPESYKNLKERKVQCPHCQQELSRLDKHACRMRPQVSPLKNMPASKRQMRTHDQPNVGPSTGAISRSGSHLHEPSGRDSPSAAMSALNVSSGNRDQPALTEINSIIKEFDEYMQSTEGSKCKPNTREQYRGKINNLLKFIAGKKGPDAPREIMAITHANHGQYEVLPPPGVWIDATYPKDNDQLSSKCGGMNAYKKFCDFLLFKLEENIRIFLNMDEYTRRKEFILSKRKRADDLDKDYGNRIKVNQQTNAQTSEVLGEKETVPTHVMQKIFDDYNKSEMRREFYTALSRKMVPMKTGLLSTRERIRDWLALELFLKAAGCRTDVIRNIKVRELINAEKYKDGNYWIISVGEHKTGKSYGCMKIQCPKDLYKLLTEFVAELYPGKFGKNSKDGMKEADLEDYIFNTNRGTKVSRLQQSVNLWRMIIPESFGNWHPTPYDFRHFCATKYQLSNDDEVRRNAPEMIGHSEETERRRYFNKDAKNDLHYRITKKVLGADHLLDPEDNDNDPSYVPTSDNDDNSDDELPDGAKALSSGQKFRTQKIEQQKEQREKEAFDKKVAAFQTTGRHKVTPEERAFLRRKFDHFGRETLLKSHIMDAKKDQEFLAIFQAIKQRQNFTDDNEVIKLIQESYKASIRTEKNKKK